MSDELQNEQRGLGLSLALDAEGRALLASIAPDPLAAPIDEAWLQAKIAALGYGAWRYLPQAGTLLLGQYNSASVLVGLRLAECVDARMSLAISGDGMSALLNITPAEGGALVSKENILLAVQTQGIVEGLLLDAVNQAIADGCASDLVIARGRPPQAGADGYFESLIPEAHDRTPRLDAAGFIDYRDLGEILVVHPGDSLVLRHRAQDGVPGATLLGTPIPAPPGKDVMFAPNLSGVSFAADNPDLLQAAVAGQPVLVKGGAMVEPVFSLPAVNVASGNINFDGSIVINGDVSAGMTVRASGDIEVSGVVEAATLEAGGNIVIKGGAMGRLGRKDGGEYFMRCGGSFSASYVQQVSVDAGDSIFIDDMAMQSELAAANHIRVGNKKRGHIVGGKAKATLSITAKVLGSPNRVATHCEVGVNPALNKQLQEMNSRRDALETQLLEISKLLDFARHNPAKVRPEMVDKARQSAANISAAIAAQREDELALSQKIALAQQSCVIAEQALYEGLEVVLGNQRYRVAGEHGAGKIALGKNGPALMALDGEEGNFAA